MPKKDEKQKKVSLPADSVIHCAIFDCGRGVYPKTICCRSCPLYEDCEDHCLNDPSRCNVWESLETRRNRERIIKQRPHDSALNAELEGDDV